MKKKILIPIVCVAVLAAVLFVPIKGASLDDGGTTEYKALTYKFIKYNIILDANESYSKTRFYFGKDSFKSFDELYHKEQQKIENSFVGTVTELSGNNVIVEPLEGEWERSTSNKFSISLEGMGINAKIGSKLKVYYKGDVMCIYPAIVNVIRCELVE